MGKARFPAQKITVHENDSQCRWNRDCATKPQPQVFDLVDHAATAEQDSEQRDRQAGHEHRHQPDPGGVRRFHSRLKKRLFRTVA